MTNHPYGSIRTSLLGSDGKFMTLRGLIQANVGLLCSRRMVEITGVWKDARMDESDTRSKQWIGGIRAWRLFVDGTGVSDCRVTLVGPVKMVVWPKFPEYRTVVCGNVTTDCSCEWNTWTTCGCGICNILRDSHSCQEQHEFRLAFEKLELEKRPRINLELSSKIPGDVDVIMENYSNSSL